MKNGILAIVFVILAGLGLSSCIIAVVDTSDPSSLPGWGEFHRVVPFQAGGTIMLENNKGNVEIFGWERNEVEVTARNEGLSLKPGFYWFGYPGWYGLQPRVIVDRFDDLLKIRTPLEGREDIGQNYALNVPMSVNINPLRCREGNVVLSGLYGGAVLDLRQGDVRIENFSGSLELSLGRGKAEVELLDLRRGDTIKVTVTSGDITVFLDKDVSARLEASAALGRVESEFDLGQKLPAAKAKGQLKEGHASISLTAVQGRVTIKKIKG